MFFIINYCYYVHVLVAISYLCADNHQVKVIFVSSRTLYYTTPWFPRVRVPSVGLQSTSSPCAWISQKLPLLVWMSSSLQTGKCLSNTAFHWQGLTPPLAGPHGAAGRRPHGCWSGLSEERRGANRWHWRQVGQPWSQPEGGREHRRMEGGLEAK